MLKAITVTNFKGESLRMELANPDPSGMVIFNVEGIGSGQANINTTEMATSDGGWFNSARGTVRNIVFSIKLMANPSVEENRIKSYRYFPVKKLGTYTFETDTRISTIRGYVESNEPVIFSSQEYTQISILCPDPWFYATSGSSSAFAGITPNLEFPFSNESLSAKKIEFGIIRRDNRAIIDYKGDVDTGVVITIHALGPAEHIMLYNADTLEKMSIDTDILRSISGAPFGTGDDIIISTKHGERYVHLLRNGSYTNIISAIDRESDWFQLTSGDNIFGFTTRSGDTNLLVSFEYQNAYAGV